MGSASRLWVIKQSPIVVPSRAGVGQCVAGGLQDLPAADEGLLAEPQLWGLRDLRLKRPPDAITQEMGLRPKHLK